MNSFICFLSPNFLFKNTIGQRPCLGRISNFENLRLWPMVPGKSQQGGTHNHHGESIGAAVHRRHPRLPPLSPNQFQGAKLIHHQQVTGHGCLQNFIAPLQRLG